MDRPPLPPFTLETAAQKARMAEDAWNSRDPTGNSTSTGSCACGSPVSMTRPFRKASASTTGRSAVGPMIIRP